MNVYVVVNHRRDFPEAMDGASVVSAREYFTDPAYSESRGARVLNLCRTDRYQAGCSVRGSMSSSSMLLLTKKNRSATSTPILGEIRCVSAKASASNSSRRYACHLCARRSSGKKERGNYRRYGR